MRTISGKGKQVKQNHSKITEMFESRKKKAKVDQKEESDKV